MAVQPPAILSTQFVSGQRLGHQQAAQFYLPISEPRKDVAPAKVRVNKYRSVLDFQDCFFSQLLAISYAFMELATAVVM